MKSVIRTELRKALCSKMLLISILIGVLICAADVVENYFKLEEFTQWLEWRVANPIDAKIKTGHSGYSLFYLWMGLSRMTYGGNLFYTIWPVLAAMAYGWSYSEERRSGVFNQIAARVGTKSYYIAKYIAVFISGGLAVGVPVLLDLLANALVCPYEIISPSMGPVSNCDFLSGLYYSNPWAYGLIWCGMTFLWGGAAACLCFVVGAKLRYGVIVMLTPYAIYVALDALLTSVFPTLMGDLNLVLSPLRMINSVPGYGNPAWFLFSALAVLIGGSFAIGYWQVVKHELV